MTAAGVMMSSPFRSCHLAAEPSIKTELMAGPS